MSPKLASSEVKVNMHLVHELLIPYFNPVQEEVYVVTFPSANGHPKVQLVFRGTWSSCPIWSRDILRICLAENARCAIIAHNHPLGSLRPSPQDVLAMKRIARCLDAIDVPLLDCLIFNAETCESFLYSVKKARPFKSSGKPKQRSH